MGGLLQGRFAGGDDPVSGNDAAAFIPAEHIENRVVRRHVGQLRKVHQSDSGIEVNRFAVYRLDNRMIFSSIRYVPTTFQQCFDAEFFG